MDWKGILVAFVLGAVGFFLGFTYGQHLEGNPSSSPADTVMVRDTDTVVTVDTVHNQTNMSGVQNRIRDLQAVLPKNHHGPYQRQIEELEATVDSL